MNVGFVNALLDKPFCPIRTVAETDHPFYNRLCRVSLTEEPEFL